MRPAARGQPSSASSSPSSPAGRFTRVFSDSAATTLAHVSVLDTCLLGPEPARRAELPQRLGHRDAAVLVLEVLEQRDHRARGDRGAVERVHVLELAAAADADLQAPRLVVRRVRGRGDLAVALLAGEPRLDVVLLRGGGTEVARSDVDDAVRQTELLHELLLDREQPLVLVARALGLAVD